MDLYCPKCAEPWEVETLHEMADYTDSPTPITFHEANARFQREGCEAFGCPHNTETMGSFRAQAAGVLSDLLGDDVDGIASMLEDAEFIGMFD